ncbi:MAG TPA: lytic transglycosylase domain-containing protein [Candidatus Binatia bacterium]|nr:lytic transglycosylase domain-containing protein [Candidatus Binatia bacterium]
MSAALTVLAARDTEEASALLAEAARRYPAIEDHVLYFQARTAVRAGRDAQARDAVQRLLALHPDSVWVGPADLLAGELALRTSDAAAARDFLLAARDVLPAGSERWARATVLLAELDRDENDFAGALALAREVRRSRPRSIAGRRARRLVDRILAAEPDAALWTPLEEAEMRLREGDAAGAHDAARTVLEASPTSPDRARALWVQAQAERALGLQAEAEATCRELGATEDALAPRALATAAAWRWNADDDAGAVTLFEEVIRRFPASPQAADALYAIGRIHQERALAGSGADAARDFDAAASAYTQLAHRFPRAAIAPEARWRAGWVRYLGGRFADAEAAFHTLAERSGDGVRIAAEYWDGRALERLGRTAEARERFAHVAERHRLSYYATLAEERLGEIRPAAAVVTDVDAGRPPFPGEVAGPHAERARLLAELALPRLARLEVDALRATAAPRRALLAAYTAVDAPGPALRLAREMRPNGVRSSSPGPLGHYLYPLGYWNAVSGAAARRRLDPLLVQAVIRQESLFDPDAISPADARGLMQLLPATARRLAPDLEATRPTRLRQTLHRPETNVELGTALLAQLLARYDGSAVKALAAYNAGEDAVAKWERRYGARDADEFVELISFRETRDYVKAVLRNYRVYRTLYGEPRPAKDAPSSAGSPPKAPFDMTTMTSFGRADSTR